MITYRIRLRTNIQEKTITPLIVVCLFIEFFTFWNFNELGHCFSGRRGENMKQKKICFFLSILMLFSAACSKNQKPAAISEILGSEKPITMDIYVSNTEKKGYSIRETYAVGLRIGTCEEIFAKVTADAEVLEYMGNFCDQYVSIWEPFTDSLIKYLKATSFTETETIPPEEGLLFRLDTEKGAKIYFYDSNSIKIIDREKTYYTVDSMDDLQEKFSVAKKAYGDLLGGNRH